MSGSALVGGGVCARSRLILFSCDLAPCSGQKIGIVGRTGSGKSTLALAFFRFLEAEEGSIRIDGIDIASVPLETLRSRITIIPQDAQLFSGTVRSNLDPFNVHEDTELWTALERCRLASRNTPAASRAVSRAVSRAASRAGSLHEGREGHDEPTRDLDEAAAAEADADAERTKVITSLDAVVEQGGKNFSAGQRQLLALARGLLKLRDSRFLILDESTANLDSASDAWIQRVIRKEMAPHATILTVAHRLRTIADYDRIIVLDKGTLVEHDSPANLLRREDSAFKDLCKRSGEYDLLKRMAEKAEADSAAGGA